MPNTQTSDIDLFKPLALGPLVLPNRIVMAPLTRNRAGPANVPQAINVRYYAQRASAGLIISEATQISPQGVGYPATPGIHSREQVRGWSEVTRGVHEKGGRIFLQLWHVGRISHPSLQPHGAIPVAPSPIRPAGEAVTYQGMQAFVTPRELATDEIPQIVEDYRAAARNAMEAGFDGVEIHAANGYLLDQFLRDATNHRTDRYGGSAENRSRLVCEVAEAVTSVWGSERVGIRLSPLNPFNDMYDSDPRAIFRHVVAALNELHLGYVHVVEGATGATGNAGPAFDQQELRRIFRGPYMANCGYDRGRAMRAIGAGRADLVAFGVLYIANPDLVERFARNAPLNKPDPDTFYGGNERGYTDYPFLEAGKA